MCERNIDRTVLNIVYAELYKFILIINYNRNSAKRLLESEYDFDKETENRIS